jgi:hypothetical protein
VVQIDTCKTWASVISLVVGVTIGCGGSDSEPAGPGSGRPDASAGTGGSAGSDGTGGTAGAGTGGAAGVGGGPGPDGGDADSGPPSLGQFTGRVASATSGQPLAGVTVEAGGITAVTGADGGFDLPAVPAGERVLVRLKRDGYAPGLEITGVVAGERTEGRYALLEIQAEKTFDAAIGGEAVSSEGARAKFEPNSLVRPDGTAVTGEVTLRVAPIDVHNQTQLNAFPGEFVGDRLDGTRGLLETIAPMSITVEQGGQQLDVKAGSKALVTFPANDFTYPSIELWSLDEQTGRWKEEGLAHLMTDENGRKVYRAEITHLSWWNCDRVYSGWNPNDPNAQPPPDRACVRGCVKGAPDVIGVNYQDKRVPHIASGWVSGVDYIYRSFDLTDAAGCFAVDVKPGGTVQVWADAYFGTSDSRIITVPATGATARTNPQNCTDAGELVIKPIIVAQCIGLPGTFPAYCGTPAECVDLLGDTNNCGACGRKCGSEGGGPDDRPMQPTPLECVGGECRCVGNLATCGVYQCSDTRRDRNHCGRCDNACVVGQDCIEGVCQAIQCGPGLTLCGNDCVDLKNDETHCGNCTTTCSRGDESGGLFTCVNGSCECPTGQTKCDRNGSLYCADTTTSLSDCGACGRQCTTGQECRSGACQAIVCGAGQTLCGSECVNLLTDTGHCGGCNRVCIDKAEDGGGAARCSAGSCGCAPGFTDCEPLQPLELDCRNLATDRQSCGVCGRRCAFDETCNAGTCQRISCSAGQMLCGAQCADLANDELHCGRCGNACPDSRGDPLGTPVQCLAGACACAAPTTACFTQPFYDGNAAPICVANIGSCNRSPAASCGNLAGDWMLDVCGSTELVTIDQVGCAFAADSWAHGQFTGGSALSLTTSWRDTCTATLAGDTLSGSCNIGSSSCALSGSRPACSAGQNLCGNQCVAFANDANHCGFCDNYCGVGRVCRAGVCGAAP